MERPSPLRPKSTFDLSYLNDRSCSIFRHRNNWRCEFEGGIAVTIPTQKQRGLIQSYLSQIALPPSPSVLRFR